MELDRGPVHGSWSRQQFVAEEIQRAADGTTRIHHHAGVPFVDRGRSLQALFLLWAKSVGDGLVPDEVRDARARRAAAEPLRGVGAFHLQRAYAKPRQNSARQQPAARLDLSGRRSPRRRSPCSARASVARLCARPSCDFHALWLEIALRSQQKGTHDGRSRSRSYSLLTTATATFAQAIELWPAQERERQYPPASALLREILLMRRRRSGP
jgi:hypothetical protein